MFCPRCGKEINDYAALCLNCGCPTEGINLSINDKPSFWFAFTGFFFPIVGLILFLVYGKRQPLRANSAGKGALIRVFVNIVLTVILVLLYATVLSVAQSYPAPLQ